MHLLSDPTLNPCIFAEMENPNLKTARLILKPTYTPEMYVAFVFSVINRQNPN